LLTQLFIFYSIAEVFFVREKKHEYIFVQSCDFGYKMKLMDRMM